MKSIALLEEQIKIYEELTGKSKNDYDEMRNRYIKTQSIYADYKGKLDGLKQILGLVKDDFNTYTKLEKKSDSEVTHGKVKWFNAENGYGFIESNDGKDVFAHFTRIITDGFKCLNEGDEVQFVVSEGARGLEAFEIRKIEKPTK